MSKAYEISEDNFTGAVARLVEKFKAEDQGIGEFKVTCHDGSTVHFKFRDKAPKTQKAPKR